MRLSLLELRRLANAFLVLSLLALTTTALALVNKRAFVVDTIHIDGDRAMLPAVRAPLLNGLRGKNLLFLDMHRWKQEVENLPGIAQADLRRVLPTTLVVHLYAHEPLARWDGGGLIDVNGKRYQAAADAALPIFKGQDGYAEQMADFYFDAVLILRDVGAIAQLELLPRGDWRLFLRDGIVLYLGNEAPRKRLRLFTTYAAQLRRRFPQMRAVDLNYARGFAVSTQPWQDEKEG